MSAFLVSKETIDVIVRAALTYPPHGTRLRWHWTTKDGMQRAVTVGDDPTEIGAKLWQWNLDSVNARYPDTTPETWGFEPYVLPRGTGPIDLLTQMHTHKRPDPVVVLKQLDCLRYQSCEHADWDKCEGHAIHEAIRDYAIKALPGYSEAPWGIAE